MFYEAQLQHSFHCAMDNQCFVIDFLKILFYCYSNNTCHTAILSTFSQQRLEMLSPWHTKLIVLLLMYNYAGHIAKCACMLATSVAVLDHTLNSKYSAV